MIAAPYRIILLPLSIYVEEMEDLAYALKPLLLLIISWLICAFEGVHQKQIQLKTFLWRSNLPPEHISIVNLNLP